MPGIPPSVETITYFAIDANGAVVSQIGQNRSMTDFGVISDELPAGTYTIEMFATTTGYAITKDMVTNSSNIANEGKEFWKDSFATKFTLTIANTDVSTNVNLHRVVGQITLKILDAIPNNVNKITVSVSSDADSYYFETDGIIGPIGSNYLSYSKARQLITTIPSSAKGKTDFQISVIVLDTSKKHTVTVTSYDVKGIVLTQTVISQVGVQRNTNTILSGKLFGTDVIFDVGLNHEWSNNFNYDF